MANAREFLFWNSVFYIPLAVLIVYRYSIQGLGYSGLAMFAGVAEMFARAMVGFAMVPVFGYWAGCHRQPGGLAVRLCFPAARLPFCDGPAGASRCRRVRCGCAKLDPVIQTAPFRSAAPCRLPGRGLFLRRCRPFTKPVQKGILKIYLPNVPAPCPSAVFGLRQRRPKGRIRGRPDLASKGGPACGAAGAGAAGRHRRGHYF